MDVAKILFGLTQLLLVVTLISFGYSKYKNGKTSKIQKHTYFLGFITSIAIVGSIYFAQVRNTELPNVVKIANDSNEQLNTPREMGNGFRMEPIVGYEKTLKFTFTFLSSVQNKIDQIKKNLVANNMIEKTCNSIDAKINLSKGIDLEYIYIDFKGNEIATFKVAPGDCNSAT